MNADEAKRIMVVEDEVIVSNHIERKLRSRGFEVPAVVQTGEDAVRRAGEVRPDLILMDIRLAGQMDGVEAADLIRKRFHIPVVYLTAYADDDTLARAKITEPFGYINKPYEAQELHTAIEIALYRHEMDERLRVSEERYALAARGANDGLWDWDLNTNRLYLSPRWKAILGRDNEELGSEPSAWFDLVHPEDLPRLQEDLQAHLDGNLPHLEHEYRIHHADGSYRWVFVRGMAVRGPNGRASRVAGSQSDVHERRTAEEQLLNYTFNDPLTGLPNRLTFLGLLDRTARSGASFALYKLDMDHFRDLNRRRGFYVGDSILTEAALRLKTLENGSIVARGSGDEFLFLQEKIASEEECRAFGGKLSELFKEPFRDAEGQLEELSACIGATLSRSPEVDAEDVILAAEEALDRARTNGSGAFSL